MKGTITYGEGAKESATPQQLAAIERLSAEDDVRVEETGGTTGSLHAYIGAAGHEETRHWIDPYGTISLTEHDPTDTGDWR